MKNISKLKAIGNIAFLMASVITLLAINLLQDSFVKLFKSIKQKQASKGYKLRQKRTHYVITHSNQPAY